MAEVVFEGHACVDCTMAIANGDTSGIDDLIGWEQGVERQNLSEMGTVVMACPEECEGHFSTRRCDYCGTSYHGDRHPIAVLADNPVSEILELLTPDPWGQAK